MALPGTSEYELHELNKTLNEIHDAIRALTDTLQWVGARLK